MQAYIKNKKHEKPFFMFVSQLEPHHQNDRGHFEGPTDKVDDFRDYPLPEDLTFLKGNYKEEYPDYLAAIHSLDENVGRLVKALKDKGLYDNTVIVYTSDHGCHFKTRNAEYKRSCHDSSIHTPLVFGGGAVDKGGIMDCLVSLIDIPPTLLSLAEIEIPKAYSGNILPVNRQDVPERDCVFIQISESQVGRAVRTKDWKYSAKALGPGNIKHSARIYYDDFLYDLKNGTIEEAMGSFRERILSLPNENPKFEKCKTCRALPLCNWCPGRALLACGQADAFMPEVCRVAEKRYDALMKGEA